MNIEHKGFEGDVTFTEGEAEYKAVIRYRRDDGNVFQKEVKVRGNPTETRFESAIGRAINKLENHVGNSPKKDFSDYEIVGARIEKTETVFQGEFEDVRDKE